MRAVVACLLAGLASAAGAAEPPKPAPSRPAHAATAEQVAADPAGVWARFRAGAEFGASFKAFDVIEAVGYDYASVDAEKCREHAATLREAVDAVPVSIALHRVALMCAEAVGDTAAAEGQTLALGALSKLALADSGDTPWRRPILVLSPRDIYALLALLGYEFRYEYFRDVHPKRYFPLVVAAWDPEAKVERHLSFDYIDAIAAIERDATYPGTATQRHALAQAVIDSQGKSQEPAALDLLAVLDAMQAENAKAQLDRLREGAAHGGLVSIMRWVRVCAERTVPGCEDGLVDTLLPLAERQHAVPLALMSVLYARGIGVPRDALRSTALLDAADARWDGAGGTTYFAAMQLAIDGRVSEDMQQRLRKVSRERPGPAEMMAVLAEFSRDQKHVLSERDLAVLTHPASNGVGIGHATLAEYHEARGNAAKALEAARLAAEQGNAASQRKVALHLLDEEGDAARARWQPMLEDAARGGDVIAMRVLAEEARGKDDPHAAAGWLIAGVQAGDIGALLEYSHLLASGAEGLSGTAEDAVANFEAIVADGGEHASVARQALAALAVTGRGMKRNPKRAREWLLVDAERGNVTSQWGLFQLHRDDRSGVFDEAEAMRWADRAASDDKSALAVSVKSDYGTWLVARKEAARRTRGIALMRESVRIAKDDQATHAANNLAWALCVSPFDDVRDPADGLAVALRMDQRDLPPGELDTVAACHAASGDFPAAVRVQQRAFDDLPRDAEGKSPAWADGIVSRLALYKAGKAYIEADANAP